MDCYKFMKIDGGFPIYILDDDTIVFEKRNVDHSVFWKNTVCKIVSKKYKICSSELKNLPYCQRRGRVIENIFYYGEKLSNYLFRKIEKTVDKKLRLIYDEHETRCKISVSEFNALKNPYL